MTGDGTSRKLSEGGFRAQDGTQYHLLSDPEPEGRRRRREKDSRPALCMAGG